MNAKLKSFLLNKTAATDARDKEVIQTLWSGYGSIQRILLEGSELSSVIVKHIQLHKTGNHPRGWNSDMGHQRKLRSYKVEVQWYQNYNDCCEARIPKCYGVMERDNEVWILLEDLDTVGYFIRKQRLDWTELSNCLQWLAQFHACFLHQRPVGLWEKGTYWHLDTRPQELEELSDLTLKNAAARIDQKLSDCNYKTLVHGDAKLANFCFSDNSEVAGVDFQYVGGGCGMKDVAYFVGSCLDEVQSEAFETKILDTYFFHLKNHLNREAEKVEEEWRPLYSVAWADFHRFLKGWSPGHWKINSYSERITQSVISNL
ncbi:phosphotransferase [Croceivirga thetidis]|uniref:Phosphotransferase n=1 Tax=Croceivirga thetidis TaxID=2721623 RepID=A0ABX1GNX4_9FLAO|nr:phosphotransferase [Croceivirga thetidis]NKI30760.1 phosphotransferase [Croceivirga thetidis]